MTGKTGPTDPHGYGIEIRNGLALLSRVFWQTEDNQPMKDVVVIHII